MIKGTPYRDAVPDCEQPYPEHASVVVRPLTVLASGEIREIVFKRNDWL